MAPCSSSTGHAGDPGQFEHHAEALRNAGMVAVLADHTTFAEGANSADTADDGRSAV